MKSLSRFLDKASQTTKVLVSAVILGAGIFVLGGLALVVILGQDSNISVRDMVVTNVTDSALTVTWVSDNPYVGRIFYKEGEASFSGVFAQSGAMQSWDDRDVELNKDNQYVQIDGGAKARYTHHVTVRDLKPEATYSFRVGGTLSGKEGEIKSAMTMKLREQLNQPDPAYGKVEGVDNADSFVYVSIPTTNEFPALLSATTATNGTYSLDFSALAKNYILTDVVASIRTTNRPLVSYQFKSESYKPLETIKVEAQVSAQSTLDGNILGTAAAQARRSPEGPSCSASFRCQDSSASGLAVTCQNGPAAGDGKVDCTCGNGTTIVDIGLNSSNVAIVNCIGPITPALTPGTTPPATALVSPTGGNYQGDCNDPAAGVSGRSVGDIALQMGLNCTDPNPASRDNNYFFIGINCSSNADNVPPAANCGASPIKSLNQLCRERTGTGTNPCANITGVAVLGTATGLNAAAPEVERISYVSRWNGTKCESFGNLSGNIAGSMVTQADATVGRCQINRGVASNRCTILPNRTGLASVTIPAGQDFYREPGSDSVNVCCAVGSRNNPANSTTNGCNVTTTARTLRTEDRVEVALEAEGITIDRCNAYRVARLTTDASVAGGPYTGTPVNVARKMELDVSNINSSMHGNLCINIVNNSAELYASCRAGQSLVLVEREPIAGGAEDRINSFSCVLPIASDSIVIPIPAYCFDDKDEDNIIAIFDNSADFGVDFSFPHEPYNAVCDSRAIIESYYLMLANAGHVRSLGVPAECRGRIENTDPRLTLPARLKILEPNFRPVCEKYYGSIDLTSIISSNNQPRLNGLVKGISAQTATNTVEVTESGRYSFTGSSGAVFANADIVVDPAAGKALVGFYNDINGNGQKDANEPFAEGGNQDITLEKESSAISYDLNAGWNLIHIPMIDNRADNPVLKASDLLKYWNAQGAKLIHVAKYDGSKFTMVTLREGTDFSSADFILLPGMGLFVFNDGDSIPLVFSGNYPETARPVNLANGWNLVGIYAPNQSYTSEALLKKMEQAGVKADTLSQFENGTYQSVVLDNSTLFGNNFNIVETRGYFTRVAEGGGRSFTP